MVCVDSSCIKHLKYMLPNCKIQSLFYFTPLQDDHIDDILVFYKPLYVVKMIFKNSNDGNDGGHISAIFT